MKSFFLKDKKNFDGCISPPSYPWFLLKTNLIISHWSVMPQLLKVTMKEVKKESTTTEWVSVTRGNETFTKHHTRNTIQKYYPTCSTYLLWLWFSNVDLDSRQPFLDERPDERPLNTCLNHLTHYRLYKLLYLSSSWNMKHVHQFSQEGDTRKQPKLFTMAICLLGAFFLPFLINLIPAY